MLFRSTTESRMNSQSMIRISRRPKMSVDLLGMTKKGHWKNQWLGVCERGALRESVESVTVPAVTVPDPVEGPNTGPLSSEKVLQVTAEVVDS